MLDFILGYVKSLYMSNTSGSGDDDGFSRYVPVLVDIVYHVRGFTCSFPMQISNIVIQGPLDIPGIFFELPH